MSELFWTDEETVSGFSYPLPNQQTRVHNANFLGAALFCKVAYHTGDKKFLSPAMDVIRYSADRQHSDGSWDYGDFSTQRWVDNFHTGFNLCALKDINKYAGTTEFYGTSTD